MKKICLWWRCKRCGKLIPYMADFCHECADKLLGEAPKPFVPPTDKEYEAKVITRGNCMICGKELTEGLFFCKECEEKSKK